ncbi:hypothetical protein HS088_TW19G00825 [Tripterygium wilfordii]|uniref:Uncharacterized protein n=1 Tax=Tripterygium wilfordii TaxID=458696 RepID=A0A7J7CAS7_TRIWF|nr:hypothetical protein HS088_TW19G00825 [Tripterygium wilfordii]
MASVLASKFCFTDSIRQPTTQSLVFCSRFSEAEEKVEDEWLARLPEKKKPLYSHSLPCIAAWLRELGFYESKDDRAVWFVEKPNWHAQLSLDVTDLCIRYIGEAK